MNKIIKQIKEKKLLVIGVLIVLILGAYYGINQHNKHQHELYLKNSPKITFKNDLVLEYGQKDLPKLETLVDTTNKDNQYEKIELAKDSNFDTTILGKNKVVTVLVTNKDITKEFKILYTTVDTKKPTIDGVKDHEITVGDKLDLLKDVKAKDEVDGNLKVTLEGKYDINKPDTYKLKYVATDKNNNKTEQDFTLTVKAKPKPVATTSSSNNDYYDDSGYDNSNSNISHNSGSDNNSDGGSGKSSSNNNWNIDDYTGAPGEIFYKDYSSFDACQASLEEELFSHDNWSTNSCYGTKMFYELFK